MFNLEKAVNQWCSEVIKGAGTPERRDELKDHLYSDVERLQAQGLTQEQAFRAAIERLGETTSLAGEYAKNHNLLNKICVFENTVLKVADNTVDGENKMPISSKIIITQSILWAVAILASAIVLTDTEQAYQVVFLILTPLAVVSTLSLGAKSNKADRCVKRYFSKIFGSKAAS
jgi:ABC-type multidrug transport system fused ATPase/permease subunit